MEMEFEERPVLEALKEWAVKHPHKDQGLSLQNYAASVCQPRSCTNWGVGGYEIPNVAKNKTRSGLGLEWIKNA